MRKQGTVGLAALLLLLARTAPAAEGFELISAHSYQYGQARAELGALGVQEHEERITTLAVSGVPETYRNDLAWEVQDEPPPGGQRAALGR